MKKLLLFTLLLIGAATPALASGKGKDKDGPSNNNGPTKIDVRNSNVATGGQGGAGGKGGTGIGIGYGGAGGAGGYGGAGGAGGAGGLGGQGGVGHGGKGGVGYGGKATANNSLTNVTTYKAAASSAYGQGSAGVGCGRVFGVGGSATVASASIGIPFDSETDCKLTLAQMYAAIGRRDKAEITLDSVAHSPFRQQQQVQATQAVVYQRVPAAIFEAANRNVTTVSAVAVAGKNPCHGSSTTDMIACGRLQNGQ